MSITSRINEMSSHIEQAYDELQGLGADLTNVNKNIENISMVLDDIYDSMPQVSGEGTSLTLDDTRVGKIKSTLKGNTSQTTYSGKNLWGSEEHGSINEQTGADAYNENRWRTKGYINVLPNTQYTLSSDANSNIYYIFYYYDSSKTFISSQPVVGKESATGTTPNNCYYMRCVIADTNSIKTTQRQLEKGSTATTYEPYVGGTPSPNPSYPQPVNVVSGDNEIEICGKNILKYPYLNTTSTVSGVTFTDNGDGSITINGTSTSSTFSLWFLYENAWNYNSLSFELAPGTYTFKGLGASGVRMAINFYTSDNANQYFEVFNQDVTKTISEIVRVNARLIVNGGVTVNNLTVYPQIEVGSTSSSFEPYNGNTYPINLGVENLFDISTNTDGKVLASNGAITDDVKFTISDYIKVLPNTKYTISWVYDSSQGSDTAMRVGYYQSDKTFISRPYNTTSPYTITIPNNCYYIRLCYEISSHTQIQVAIGTNHISSTPIELCKIGNYQDYFYKDSGKWYLHKEIGKVVLNGSENWIKSASTSVDRFIEQTTRPDMSVFNGLSNYFIYNQDSPNVGTFFLDNSQNQFRGRIIINFSSYGTTTLEQFKTWLSTHNTKIYYVLSTPTNTEITYQPLIDQLNLIEKALSKQGQTNISQVNNDLPFIISASALKEWSV